MTVWRWATGAVLVSAAVIWSCSGGGSGNVSVPIDPNDPRLDAGITPTIDAGTDIDAGTTDAGTTDGGTDGGPTTDGGTVWVPPPPVPFPSPAPADWAFYGPQNGGPHDVLGVSADQGGNIWVAGGEDGLFLLRAGATTFERFTMDDGLRPYGYMKDGSDPVGPKFLKVISVAGGPANTVFVGYEGRNRNLADDCEGNWDGPHPDPSIYKSGDADRVTVDASGKLTVVHYDIFSGPGVVGNEPAGREKLCHVVRIVWNAATNDLWFGGNHGYAWGDPNYAGNKTCNGQLGCSGLREHGHPAFNGVNAAGGCCDFVTGDYRGVAVDPATGDVWFGGINRTTKLHWGVVTGSTKASRFDTADFFTEARDTGTVTTPPRPLPPCPDAPCYLANRIDVWPDIMGEVRFDNSVQRLVEYDPTRAEQEPKDNVSAIAAMPDGSAYIGSGVLGLRRLGANGVLISDETSRLFAPTVGGLAYDKKDGSVWVGIKFAGGVNRLAPTGSSGDQRYSRNIFGSVLENMGIEDVQIDASGPTRKVLFGFRQNPKGPAGFVAVYSGN
jgi:hypothetical protein